MLACIFFVAFSLIQPSSSESTTEPSAVKTTDQPLCYTNTFRDIANFYIQLGERWKDPRVRKRDKAREVAEKRKYLLSGLVGKYCKDDVVNEDQVYALDECIAYAYEADLDIVVSCRKFNFYTALHVKDSDCSLIDTRESIGFKECISHKMKERHPDYEMYGGETDLKRIEVLELYKFLKKKVLRCYIRVLRNYYDDLLDAYYA
ncbi:hypothetical protein HDE_04153 [Halotydeus destructor]|nr:hypothetical protein HDE_04153 [Halotydeus destructor]